MVQKSRPPLDFGAVEVGIKIQSIDEHPPANLHKREFPPKDQIPDGPIGDTEVPGCLVLGEESWCDRVRRLHAIPVGVVA
jgi:hypothetical protein